METKHICASQNSITKVDLGKKDSQLMEWFSASPDKLPTPHTKKKKCGWSITRAIFKWNLLGAIKTATNNVKIGTVEKLIKSMAG